MTASTPASSSSEADSTPDLGPSDRPDATEILAALERHFGHDRFREGQLAAIEAATAGRDLLVVMPTGSGKSLCYQLPALLQPGYTLVISPLIALMKDQVDQLRSRGIAAATVHSGTKNDEKWRIAEQLESGTLKVLLVAPERLRLPRFLDFIRRHPPHRLAVDEAHCISSWGHDFRPDYRRIRTCIDALGGLPVSALTATATPDVRADIAAQLGLEDPAEILTGFDRPNLTFEVVHVKQKAERIDVARAELEKIEGLRLVYTASRRSAEELRDALTTDTDWRVGLYHAGLGDAERTRVQDEFMEGGLDVLVATNAFGMGVDKRDVRLVLHLELPGSLEAYYQEAGRAGRDGEPSRCVLLTHSSDVILQRFFLDNANPTIGLFEKLHGYLASRRPMRTDPDDDLVGPALVPIDAIADALGERSTGALETALRLYQQVDAVRLQPGGVQVSPQFPTRVPLDLAALDEKRRRDEERLARMTDYTRLGGDCRLARIREYFLGQAGERCGSCDLCLHVDSGVSYLDDDELELLRQIVQLVGNLDLRFGPHRFAQILAGTATGNAHSTFEDEEAFALLSSRGEKYARDLIEYLDAHGLLFKEPFTSSDGQRRGSLLGVSAPGWEFLEGQIPPLHPLPEVRSRRRSSAKPSIAQPTHLPPADPQLHDWLRDFRQKLCRESGRPAYTFFSNETLDLLSRTPPSSRAEFLDIKGLGEKRWEEFGASLVEELQRRDGDSS